MFFKSALKKHGIEYLLTNNKKEIQNIYTLKPKSDQEAFLTRKLFKLFNKEHSLFFSETNLYGSYDYENVFRGTSVTGIHPIRIEEFFVYVLFYCKNILSNHFTSIGCYNYIRRWLVEHNARSETETLDKFLGKLTENVK